MRRFLAIFCWLFVGFISIKLGWSTPDSSAQGKGLTALREQGRISDEGLILPKKIIPDAPPADPGSRTPSASGYRPQKDLNLLSDYQKGRGDLLLSRLKQGKISCKELWEAKEHKKASLLGLKDYDLPQVKEYCSKQSRGWQEIEEGKGKWRPVFANESVKKDTVVRPVSPLPSRGYSEPLPSSSVRERVHRSASFLSFEDDEEDSGVDESDELTSVKRSGHRKVTPRSPQPFRPVVWRGGEREAGNAQAKVESVYETTKAHIEEMHAKWEELEDDHCNGNASCLGRLKKSKADLKKHIKGLEKYIDSLERHNDFLFEALERHLAEDRGRLSRQSVQQLQSYLEGLKEENRDLEERIKVLRVETEALIESLEGKASHQETKETYERAARTGKKKATGSPGSQGPLKVKETLDSLKAEVEAYQRKGRALWKGIPSATSPVCVGTECDQLRATLSQAQTYEGEIEDLEKRIAILRARVADVRTPNGAAKASAEKQIVALQARVKELEAENARSEEALRTALGRTQDSVVGTVTPRGSVDLVAQQGELVTQVAAAQKREEALRAEIAAVQAQVARGQMTGREADRQKTELQSELKGNQREVAALRQKNYDLEKKMKEQQVGKRIFNAVQRARVQKAQADNKALTAQLVVLEEAQKRDLAELQHKLASAEVARAEAVQQATAAQQLTRDQQRKIEEFEAQIKSLEEAARLEKEKAETEAARAASLEQYLEGVVARTRDEKQDTSALERRALQAEQEAAQHKQKAEALEAKAQKVEEALVKLEGALGIGSIAGHQLAFLSSSSQTPDQRLRAIVLGIEAQKREMENQKTTLDQQAAQLRTLEKSSQETQVQMDELQRAQRQQEESLQKAKKLEEEIKSLKGKSGTGYVDTRQLERRIRELEALLKEEAAEKKRVNDIVALQKLALSKKRSDLDQQTAIMKAVEREKEHLEESLKIQQRRLEDQLKELETLRHSKHQSGQEEEEFTRALTQKQQEIDALKHSVASAQKEVDAQAKRITEQRKALSGLDKAHAKQKDILATAFLAAQKLDSENDELKRTLETAGVMGQQALAERDAAQKKLEKQGKEYGELHERHESFKRLTEDAAHAFAAETARLEKERQERERANQARWAAEQKQREEFDSAAVKRREEYERNQQQPLDVSKRMAKFREERDKKVAERLALK